MAEESAREDKQASILVPVLWILFPFTLVVVGSLIYDDFIGSQTPARLHVLIFGASNPHTLTEEQMYAARLAIGLIAGAVAGLLGFIGYLITQKRQGR